MKRWHMIAAVTLSVSLVASACSSSDDDKADRGAQKQAVVDPKRTLAELPALKVTDADTAPRGLVGDVWTVRFPATGDPARPGLGTVGGVQAKLTAATTGGTFKLYDALATGGDAAPLYTGPDPQVPAGLLRNGGVYSYTVSTDGTDEGPYTFIVRGANPASGAYAVEVAPESYTSGAGQMGIGLAFSTADIGSSAADPASVGTRKGLAPGWAWQGLGSGITEVELQDAGGFLGWTKLLIVHRDGGGAEVLGCKDAKGWICTSLDGTKTMGGLHATLADANGSTITIRDPESSRTWEAETWSAKLPKDPTDSAQHRLGHVTSSSAPGAGTVRFTYGSGNDQINKVAWDVGAADAPLTWTILREGDARCGGTVPPGFVAVPSGAVCGWTLPSGDWMRLFYVDAGDAGPQIGRVLRLPGSAAKACADGPYTACQAQWNLVTVTDWAWSAKGHLRGIRQPAASLSALSGAADPGDDSMAARIDYDTAGRVDRITAAATAPGGARAITDQSYSGADARFAGSTHTLTIKQSGPGVAPMTSARAVDDGLRPVGELQPSGGTITTIWHRDKDLRLADITADGVSTAHVYDAYDRETATYTIPNGGLPGSCAQGATSGAACAPSGAWEQASGNQVVYDGGLPQGLVAEWYTDKAMASNPVKRTAVSTFDTAAVALALTAPDVAGLKDGGAVRIVGAIQPKATPKRLNVSVQGAGLPTGAVFVNDQYGGSFNGAAATVTVHQGNRPIPDRFEALITYDAAPPTGLQIKDPDAGPVGTTYQPSSLRQRWGVPTERRSVEAYPAGSGTFRGTAERMAYGDIDAPAVTASSTVACGTAGSWQAAADACAGGRVVGTVTRTVEPDGFGGARIASETSATGQVTKYEFWGRDETPSGIAHAGDLPAGVSSVAQLGLPKTTISPSGRRITTVYDRYGRATCDLIGTSSSSALSCTERDALLRPVTESYRSAAGATPVTVDYEYGVSDGTDKVATSVTRTRREGGKVIGYDTQAFAAGGRATTYETHAETATGDKATATTTYDYDGVGRATAIATSISASGKTSSVTTTQAYQAGTGLLQEASVGGGVSAKISYDPKYPWLQQGVSVESGGKAVVTYAEGRDGAQRPLAHTWTLSDGTKVADQVSVTSGNRRLTHTLDGVVTSYRYDDIGRLVAATTGSTTAQYGWDQDHDLICTARGLTADTGNCADAAGKVTNTYENGRLTASSDSAHSPGADAYTPSGDLTSLGDRTLSYDARHQLAQVKAKDTTVTLERDVAGRPLTYRQSGTAGSVRFAYAAADATTALATIAADGSARFTVALPGGLLWHGDGMDLVDSAGNPAVALTSAGARDAAQPTRRYGPFGEDLTPKAAPTPPATTTTTAPPATTTSTTAPAATTSTTEATTTTAPAAGSGDTTSTTETGATTTTVADGAGATTTSTTEAPASTTTTTEAPATTTSTTESTTTTTAPPAEASSLLAPNSWANRVRIDGDLLDLGARTMVPALGIFTSADPIRGGSCTPYGYTCADPVNTSDLTGTSSIPWGAIIGITLSVLLVAFVPPLAPLAVGAELATAAAVEAVATVIVSAVASAGAKILTDVIDNGKFPSWSEIGVAFAVGAVIGGVTAGLSGGALWTTKTVSDSLEEVGSRWIVNTGPWGRVDAEATFFAALRPLQAVKTLMQYSGQKGAFAVGARLAATQGLGILAMRTTSQAGLLVVDHQFESLYTGR